MCSLPLPTLDFGEAVPIFEEKSLVLLVRNLSAVRTRYRFTSSAYSAAELPIELAEVPIPQDYTQSASCLASLKAAELLARREAEAAERAAVAVGDPAATKRAMSSSMSSSSGRKASVSGRSNAGLGSTSGSTAAGAKRRGSTTTAISFSRPILSDAHEKSQPFFSEAGVTFCAQRQTRKRESALLAEKRGACFEVSPAFGTIEPWGQVAVTVSLHSAMWGLYDDTLKCEVAGLTARHIPMVARVVGSPIKLHDATLGLCNITSPPTLAWAPVPSGTEKQVKTIRVQNHGPADASLAWSMLAPADPFRPLAAGIAAAGDGRISLSLGPAPRERLEPSECPFAVSPAADVIPAGGERHFMVSYETGLPGAETGVSSALLEAGLTHPALVPLDTRGGTSDAHPPLRLALRAHSLVPRLEISERAKLKFKVCTQYSKSHASFTRCLTLSNTSPTTLSFGLEVPNPFQLVEARCSVAQFRLLGQETVDAQDTFTLPPNSSLQAVLRYTPPRRRRRHHHAADSDGASGDDDTHSVASGASRASALTSRTGATGVTGVTDLGVDQLNDPHLTHVTKVPSELRISFSNGSEQTFPLLAVVTQPFLEARLPDAADGGRAPSTTLGVDFGKSHARESPSRLVQLTNPTEAEASWSIVHVTPKPPQPGTPAASAAAAALKAGVELPTDDAGAFEFGSKGGVIPPRRGETATPVPIEVRFRPSAAGRYKSTFVVRVRAGIHARLELTAEATLREEDCKVVPLDKHLRLMLPGELS